MGSDHRLDSPDMNSGIRDAWVTEFCRSMLCELEESVDRISHCTGQLNDQQIWWRPDESMNSIANLILHLGGNVEQWIVAGIAGRTDARNRPAEFSQRDGLTVTELMQNLNTTLSAASQVLSGVGADNLLQRRSIQGFEVTGMQAIVASVAHFRGHTQEIIHMTRIQLGSRYQFAFVPRHDQQGSAGASPASD